MTTITLLEVHVGTPAPLAERRGEIITSGIRKVPVESATIAVSRTNIAGDGQADLVHHGGLDKAVYCYPADNFPFWRESIGYEGDGVHSAFGQNLTVAGIDETQVCIGDIWQWGDVTLQISQPRWPCSKLNQHSGVKKLSNALIHSARSGWYLRVLEPGVAPTSGEIQVIERDPAGIAVREAFEARRDPAFDPGRHREIMSHPALAKAWAL
jgi:MOSC domain-containing protein YiiM